MTHSHTHVAHIERRSGADRRGGPKPLFSIYYLTGRREKARRAEDRKKSCRFDRYSGKTFLVILLIILLSVTDAAMTLHLISLGALELNPIMAYYLGYGPLVFFSVKYFLTCAPMVIILLRKNDYLFRSGMRIGYLYPFFLLSYVLVVQWEVYLLLSK